MTVICQLCKKETDDFEFMSVSVRRKNGLNEEEVPICRECYIRNLEKDFVSKTHDSDLTDYSEDWEE